MSKPSKPTYALVLEALPDQDGPGAVLRLRRLLKYAGRVCRLRCVEAHEIPALVAVGQEQMQETTGKQDISRNMAANSDALSTK